MTVYILFFIISLGIVSMIMIRTLRRDIARYNKEEEMVSKSYIQRGSVIDCHMPISLTALFNATNSKV